ncbi:MAG: Prolipoprotein diacylglyceryl transferase [Parcubacteria group bacterium GW2011_GWD2_38_11]|nr:MAG: Prolipoprotein diacylglyceryl transferase [Parcubacteria group bacterium GW2011_GWD2_38_11]
MIFDFYQNIPLYIDPIAFTIGSFTVRWYGVSYIVGFVVVYLVLFWRTKKGEFPKVISHQSSENKGDLDEIDDRLLMTDDCKLILDFLLVSFFAALIGGRLGYVLFYNAKYYFANPLAIISPYDFQSAQFVGLFGMSYHGALLAIIIASYLFTKKKKIDFFSWADFIVVAVPLGYFFGRIGNFLNGELYGRVTNSALGMYFSASPGRLRHPSQLYEAFLEGMLLFIILWKVRGKKNKKGTLLGIYLAGYGLLRIFVEQFRQPDSQLGFLWHYFTMGQLLSLGMIIFGVLLLIPKSEK